MALKFYNYIDHLDNVNFWKYDVLLKYYDIRFRYGNVNPSGTHKFRLEVYGTVNPGISGLDPKEYLIYSEERTDTVDEWVVRIPEISPKNAWNESPNQVSPISPFQNIYSGVGYGEPNLVGTGVAVFVAKPDQITRELRQNQYVNVVFTGGEYIPVNINDRIRDHVVQYYGRFNDYPGLSIEGTGENNSQYYFIPIGVSSYKVVMKSATGESVITNIPGSLKSKQYLAVGASPTYPPSPNTPVGPISITLDAIEPNGSTNTAARRVPNVIGYRRKDAKSAIENAGYIFRDGMSLAGLRRVHRQYPAAGTSLDRPDAEVFVYDF